MNMATPVKPFVRTASPFAELMTKQMTTDAEPPEHLLGCRCETCLTEWIKIGPDACKHGKLIFGPFTEAEVYAHLTREADAYMATWRSRYGSSGNL